MALFLAVTSKFLTLFLPRILTSRPKLFLFPSHGPLQHRTLRASQFMLRRAGKEVPQAGAGGEVPRGRGSPRRAGDEGPHAELPRAQGRSGRGITTGLWGGSREGAGLEPR